MGNYILNPDYKLFNTEKIFNILLSHIEPGRLYPTLKGKKIHKILKIENDMVLIERMQGDSNPKLSFCEIRDVIELFRFGGEYNTASLVYHSCLRSRNNKTPLLSLLFEFNIIVKK